MDEKTFLDRINGNINRMAMNFAIADGSTVKLLLKKEPVSISFGGENELNSILIKFPQTEAADKERLKNYLKQASEFKNSPGYKPNYGCFALVVAANGIQDCFYTIQGFETFDVGNASDVLIFFKNEDCFFTNAS